MTETPKTASPTQHLHIKPISAADDTTCQVHDWPTEGLPARLVSAMKDTHPHGINVCRPCVDRAHVESVRERTQAPGMHHEPSPKELLRLKLPHGEGDIRKQYTLANPDALEPAFHRLYRAMYYRDGQISEADIRLVLMLAGDYLHLTTYELGQEHCVKQLRDMWRARRLLNG